MPDNALLSDFAARCRRLIAGELRDDLYTRVLYSTDASLYQVMPQAILIPRTADDVVAAMTLAGEYGLPVLARAAGTSLAGQAVNEGLVIDFSCHIDAIVEVNPEEQWARVQPGVVLDDLNAALRPHKLQFGPDPASSNRSTIGGAVANNATGSHSLLYGMTADHVRGMTAVLSEGTICQFDPGKSAGEMRVVKLLTELLASPDHRQSIRDGTPSYWRRCGGYNLDRLLTAADLDGTAIARLVCGSEGTLAVMTEITVGLVPLPAATGLLLLHFNDLHAALSAVPAILETGPSAVELLDTLSLMLCRGVPEYDRLLASVVEGQPHSLLVVEYQGESRPAVLAGVERMERLGQRERLGISGITRALDAGQQAAIWRVRKVGLGLLMSMKGDMKPVPFIEDAAVPVEHLPDYVGQIESYCADLRIPVTYYAHAGAGCLHIRPLINRRNAEEVARMPDIARFAAGLVKGYGGALSSEHGDGRSRSWLNETFYGPELYNLFRQVKRIFDPHNSLNPGNIVDAAAMTTAMRPISSFMDPSVLNFDDYNRLDDSIIRIVNKRPLGTPSRKHPNDFAQDGLARAVEMCNGAGICRQRISGTMCPSFMVTREEMHSTRGRANALRAAMSGVLPAEELTSPRMHEVMDLCIACKACKAECPSAVDMARLKTEFLARYQAVHGTPLRSKFFAHSATLNRLGSGGMAAISHRILRSRPGRWAAARWLGIAQERSLPLPARVPFDAWWRHRDHSPGDPGLSSIVLLIDPFTNYNSPEVGIAAVEFLESVGVGILAAPVIDDGRPAISKGIVGAARRAAENGLAVLHPWAEAGRLIVGLEPSSLLTLRDEWLYLLPDDNRTRVVADQALTFEEYVDRLAVERELSPFFTRSTRQILLHGHCHQKALVGTGPARRVLALPPGYVVEEVDSGCCGMAGAFGYEAEHYAISMQMAERRLLPAVRAAGTETIIAAAGLSCREQIAHGSGSRVALHPAQILRDALRDNE